MLLSNAAEKEPVGRFLDFDLVIRGSSGPPPSR